MYYLSNRLIAAVTVLLLLCSTVVADDNPLSIEITKGEADISIAIVPFEMKGVSQDILQPADVIKSDLESSSRFDVIPNHLYLSGSGNLSSIQYKNWRLIKAETVVVGQVINIGNSQYEVRFKLFDAYNEKQLAGKRFLFSGDELRQVTHQISDIVYQELTGNRGAFNTRIAYVMVQRDAQKKPTFYLQIADSDGWGAKPILQSPESILSPAWSPDGNWLAYVSFENNRSMVFIQNVWSGKRQNISGYEGINSAPAWSPDGKKLALVLSKEGNSDIYIKDLATGKLRKITDNIAIDTEPSWSPDGKKLLFTSDRSGTPQIYQVLVENGIARRITFEGTYNAAASYSPDTKKMTFITKQGMGFKVALYSFADKSIKMLTESRQDESPSFAPNGDMIVYATRVDGRGVLSTVSSNGRVKKILSLERGGMREPAWSPYKAKL